MPLFNSVRQNTTRLHYYEDLYGKRNIDEVLDRADQCEDESSNDEKEEAARSNIRSADFFKKFSRPKVQSSEETSTEAHLLTHLDITDRDFVSGEPSTTKLTSSTTDMNTDIDEQGHNYNYKISPKVNSKRSIKAPSKMLTPKKGGLFSDVSAPTEDSYARNLDFNFNFDDANPATPTETSNTMATYPTPRSTSQIHEDKSLDPFLHPNDLGDLTDSFATLEENENAAFEAMPENDFLAGLSDFANTDIDQGAAAVPFTSSSEWRAPVAEMAVQGSMLDLPLETSDNDLIDQMDARDLENQPHSSGDQLVRDSVEGAKHRSANGRLPPTTTVSSAPRSTANSSTRARDTLQSSESRYTTRGEQRRAADRQEAERLAKRPRTRSIATTTGPTTKPTSTRSKDTARYATLCKKAKRKVTREDVARAAEAGAMRVSKGQLKRGIRDAHAGRVWINFRGEKVRLEAGQGYVVLPVE